MPHATPTHMDTHTHPHTHSQSHTHLVMPASHYGAGRIMLVAKHCQTVAINAAGGGGGGQTVGQQRGSTPKKACGERPP